MVSRPVGGVLSSASRRLGDHPSVRPTSGVSVPGDRRTGRSSPTFGLAPGGVCRAIEVTPDAGALLPHRFTLTCARGPSAVCSLWHFPAGRPDWPLASTMPGGAPTFLSTVAASAAPNRGHPSDSPSPHESATRSDCRDEVDRSGISPAERRGARTQVRAPLDISSPGGQGWVVTCSGVLYSVQNTWPFDILTRARTRMS